MHSNRTEAQFFSLSANLIFSGYLYLRFAASSFLSINSAKMEVAKEQSLLISPSSIEKPQTDTTIHMARQRSISQIVTSIVLTESIWHILYIISLFYTSSLLPPPENFNFDSELNAKWVRVHANLESVLRAEACIFAAVFLIQHCFEAYSTIRVEQTWMRPVESGEFRLLALILQLGNVIISIQFVFWPFICRTCEYNSEKRRLCALTKFRLILHQVQHMHRSSKSRAFCEGSHCSDFVAAVYDSGFEVYSGLTTSFR